MSDKNQRVKFKDKPSGTYTDHFTKKEWIVEELSLAPWQYLIFTTNEPQ